MSNKMAGDYQYYRIEKRLDEIEDLLSEVLRRLGNMEYKGQIKYGTPNMVSDDHFKYVELSLKRKDKNEKEI